jgi:hypothetical protein
MMDDVGCVLCVFYIYIGTGVNRTACIMTRMKGKPHLEGSGILPLHHAHASWTDRGPSI